MSATKEKKMKNLLCVAAFIMAVLTGCADKKADPVDIDFVGTWRTEGSYDNIVMGTVKETWTFGATTLTIDRTDYYGNPIDSTSYNWEKIAIGHIVLNGNIDVIIDELYPFCFVLKSMPDRDYAHQTAFFRPVVQ